MVRIEMQGQCFLCSCLVRLGVDYLTVNHETTGSRFFIKEHKTDYVL